jgi:hypothetical protein
MKPIKILKKLSPDFQRRGRDKVLSNNNVDSNQKRFKTKVTLGSSASSSPTTSDPTKQHFVIGPCHSSGMKLLN